MKLLLATGIESLDEYITTKIKENPSYDIEIVGEVYYRGALNDYGSEIDVVIISEELPGDNEDFVGKTIYSLREKGTRVILLPGDSDSEDAQQLVRKCTPLGVYDYVYNNVTFEAIIEKLLNPSTLKDVPIEIVEMQTDLLQKQNNIDIEDQIIRKAKTIEKHVAQNKRPARSRKGKPSVVLCLGSQQLDDWFNSTFSDVTDINATTSTAVELTKAIEKYKPDIAVVMRSGPMGGIPDAADLAESACQQVPAVLFIAGELDEHGKEMESRVKSVGGYVLSCPKNETISGDELVFLMQAIMRALSKLDEADNEHVIGNEDKEDKKHKLQIDSLKTSVTSLSKLLKDNKNKPSLKARIKNAEGLSFREDSPIQQFTSNVKNPTAIVPGGLLAIVTPWRPALAGRLAAATVNMFAKDGEEVAVIGASGHSTVSMWLDISDDELMMSDWRVPGSQAPIIKDKLKIWAIDPAKALHTNIDTDLLMHIKKARKTATYTVVDYAGDFELAQKAAFQGRAVVLVIVPWSDPVESKTTLLWLNRFMEEKENIIPGIDLRGEPAVQPEEFKPKVIVKNYPANAMLAALEKNLDEYVWK